MHSMYFPLCTCGSHLLQYLSRHNKLFLYMCRSRCVMDGDWCQIGSGYEGVYPHSSAWRALASPPSPWLPVCPPLCPLCSAALAPVSLPHLSLRACTAWASCSHFIFCSVTSWGINHVFRGGHSAIYLSDTSSIRSPVAGHSPLSSKITHYRAPLPLPALSIDWLFNSGIALAPLDIIYALHVWKSTYRSFSLCSPILAL